MSNYTKLTDFASKDALPSGNANKILKGTEIDDELEAIETAIATKADSATAATSANPTFTGTVDAGDQVKLGAWYIYDSGTELIFKYNTTDVFKIDSSGNITAIADITAYGTV